ncbi:MAG: alpha/beta fold hydrolase [Chloroflexota bacterium]
MTTQWTTSPDGTRLAFDLSGQGFPLLLLHGAGKTRRDWRKVGYIERLEKRFTVIAMDLRGSGDSDFRTQMADYTIEKLLDDVYAVADACGCEQFLAWGYSFGGNIARYLGAWSQRVKAVVITGVPFGPAVDRAFDAYIDEFVQKWEPLARAEQSTGGKPGKSKIKGHIPVWLACFPAMRAWPPIEPGQMNCPALLLSGTKNTAVMDWLEANRPALQGSPVQLELVEGLNHPQEFSQIERVYSPAEAFLAAHAD